MTINRGCWFKTAGLQFRKKCVVRRLEPADEVLLPHIGGLMPDTSIGPVHSWEHTDRFSNVLVPNP